MFYKDEKITIPFNYIELPGSSLDMEYIDGLKKKIIQAKEDNKLVILMGLNLTKMKGARTAFQAIKKVKQIYPESIIYTLEYAKHIDDKKINMLPENDNIHLSIPLTELEKHDIYLFPRVPYSLMPELLKLSDISLGQFSFGLFSMFELEVMALGIPLITDFKFDELY